MQVARLLRLLPPVFGLVLAMAGIGGPGQAEANFCKWIQSVADVSDSCLHGLPDLAFWLLSAFLVFGGLVWLFWPSSDRARLKISGPHLHHGNDPRINDWRMEVRNKGPATATGVQMRLSGIEPRPRYKPWTADYPYPVAMVGPVGNAQFSCRVGRADEAVFACISGWESAYAEFFTSGLDTKSQQRNPIRIEVDERWELKYVVTAENAKQIKFSLEVYIEGKSVLLKRKS
jgi:hypothetical protein